MSDQSDCPVCGSQWSTCEHAVQQRLPRWILILRERPRLRPVALDDKLASSRSIPRPRSLGLRTEDRADMGQTQHRTWKISERPDRTLHTRGEGQAKLKLIGLSTLLGALGREHSRKPNEFYEIVDEMRERAKLDYFGGDSRQGGYPLRGLLWRLTEAGGAPKS